jgi:hypothetical protein
MLAGLTLLMSLVPQAGALPVGVAGCGDEQRAETSWGYTRTYDEQLAHERDMDSALRAKKKAKKRSDLAGSREAMRAAAAQVAANTPVEDLQAGMRQHFVDGLQPNSSPNFADAASAPTLATTLPPSTRLSAFLRVWEDHADAAMNGAAAMTGPLLDAHLAEMAEVAAAMREQTEDEKQECSMRVLREMPDTFEAMISTTPIQLPPALGESKGEEAWHTHHTHHAHHACHA